MRQYSIAVISGATVWLWFLAATSCICHGVSSRGLPLYLVLLSVNEDCSDAYSSMFLSDLNVAEHMKALRTGPGASWTESTRCHSACYYSPVSELLISPAVDGARCLACGVWDTSIPVIKETHHIPKEARQKRMKSFVIKLDSSTKLRRRYRHGP